VGKTAKTLGMPENGVTKSTEWRPEGLGGVSHCPGACDKGYFRGEGREAGEVGRWLENPPGKNYCQDFSLLIKIGPSNVTDD
jgi:hypothetical protein